MGGEHRGVVAAASYEARKFGVRSTMSSKIAKKMSATYFCNTKISSVQRNIRKLEKFSSIHRFGRTTFFRQAYLDVTENKKE